MKKVQFVIPALILMTLLFSCGNGKAKESKSEEKQEVVKKKVEINPLDGIKKEIDVLFNHIEKDLVLKTANLEGIKKHYSVDDGDEYGNYRVTKSIANSNVVLKMNFTVEEGVLNYITFSGIEYTDEIKAYLTSKLGEGEIISEYINKRLDWAKENYNIVYWKETVGWTINIEPKDYYPGF